MQTDDTPKVGLDEGVVKAVQDSLVEAYGAWDDCDRIAAEAAIRAYLTALPSTPAAGAEPVAYMAFHDGELMKVHETMPGAFPVYLEAATPTAPSVGVWEGAPPMHSIHRIEHDGFEGEVVGYYVTREGKRGVDLQQIGTRVVAELVGCFADDVSNAGQREGTDDEADDRSGTEAIQDRGKDDQPRRRGHHDHVGALECGWHAL